MEQLNEPKARGRQIVADNFQSKLENIQGAPPIQLGAEGKADGTRKVVEFPARLIPKDPRDSYILDKEDAYAFENQKANQSGNKQQIVRTVGPEDVDYLRRKRAVLNRLEYEDWMTKAIDMSDPLQGKNPFLRSSTVPKRRINKRSKK